MSYITIDQSNIDKEHICCAISDKKCAASYELKKDWLKKEFENGFVFRRLNERAKVFIEYGPAGFSLVYLSFNDKAKIPCFNEQSKLGRCPDKNGYVVYYTNRCPYTEYHVKESLAETAEKRKLNIKVIKLETMEQAQSAPTPATIFSLFYKGEFITTDLSVCMDSRFDKIALKVK